MQTSHANPQAHRNDPATDEASLGVMLSSIIAALLALFAFHLSLVATSAPLATEERESVKRAIALLDARGFTTEAFLLRHTTTFRGSDNWLNLLTEKENAFAASNFPFQIITLYPDFYARATDDTERAMVLLHEAQHLVARDEAAAYEYVWRHRSQLGWTQLTHGTTAAYVSIEQQTRERVPALFSCPSQNWNDCTEALRAQR